MTPWLTPARDGEAAFTEKRSRFIGRVWQVSSEDAALAHIADMRKQHWDATHNVYAYILRDGPVRYSDDGEPGGTAGQPVLNALQKQELYNVCCVVTRYFGGILLGAGGLVRAYTKSAVLAAEAAGKAEMRLWTQLTLPVPYRLLDRVRLELGNFGGGEEEANYAEAVNLTVCLPDDRAEAFQLRLTELSGGTLTAAVTGQVLRAFAL